MYTCEKCNYLCKWKSEWSRHLGTAKHKNQPFSNFCQPEATEKSSDEDCRQKYTCMYCDTVYKDKSGLWRHNKKCNGLYNLLSTEPVNASNSKTDVVLTLLKENQEFRNMMAEQAVEYKNIIAEQNTRIIELINKKNIVNNVTNNNQFNLNVFLHLFSFKTPTKWA